MCDNPSINQSKPSDVRDNLSFLNSFNDAARGSFECFPTTPQRDDSACQVRSTVLARHDSMVYSAVLAKKDNVGDDGRCAVLLFCSKFTVFTPSSVFCTANDADISTRAHTNTLVYAKSRTREVVNVRNWNRGGEAFRAKQGTLRSASTFLLLYCTILYCTILYRMVQRRYGRHRYLRFLDLRLKSTVPYIGSPLNCVILSLHSISKCAPVLDFRLQLGDFQFFDLDPFAKSHHGWAVGTRINQGHDFVGEGADEVMVELMREADV